MRRQLVGALVLISIALAPAAAFALPVVPNATSLVLARGAAGVVSAYTKGTSISAAPSNCFVAYAPLATDILHVDTYTKSDTSTGSKIHFAVHGKNVGSRTIVFHSGAESATVHVTVTP